MQKRITSEEIINTLRLEPLEGEGGMFRSTYHLMAPDGSYELCNAIYYFLCNGAFSHLHRLTSDEVYHFYMGDPLELLQLYPDGKIERIILGDDILNGQVPQAIVKAGCWQGSRVIPGGEYSLIGTSMCPGYSDDSYEHCNNPQELINKYPEASELIKALTGTTINR